jgi:hypothetical protein
MSYNDAVSDLRSQLAATQRQLKRYKDLVGQHQQVLKDVTRLLPPESRGQVVSVQKRLHQLLADEPQEPTEPVLTEGLNPQAVEAAAAVASERIQAATVRLLGLWHRHVAEKTKSLFDECDAKLNEFREQPTEESLTAFFDSYQSNSQAVREHFDDSQATDLGPKGNPFEMDDRMLRFYRLTIVEAFGATDPSPAEDPKWAAQKARSRKPEPTKLSPDRPVQPIYPAEKPPATAAPVPDVSPLYSRPTSSSTHDSVSRSATPSARRRTQQDSSQMKAMLGGGEATPQPSFEDLPRLQQLKLTLEQLEFQLTSVAQGGKDSGSEAKYYALSKKLQKVRAEVMKEQREQEAVERCRREQEDLKAQRDEHRRTFRR